MARVLILKQDLLHSDSEISTGGGLRARALGEGLTSKGHEIFYAVPRELFDLYPKEERDLSGLLWHSPGNIEYAINRSKPDIIILQWLGSYECLLSVRDIPIVIDLVAPRLLELYHRGHPLEPEIRAKTEALSLGDFFICSNQRQWYYFLPWLMLSGESDAGDLLKIVPVSAPVREPVKNGTDETVFIWGGVRWPWNNPLPFLNIVSDELKKSDRGRLLVLSGKFPYRYGAETRFFDLEKELVIHPGVELMPLLPYSRMAEIYQSGTVAIDISKDLPERRLASPFRTKEYLSCGLPLITSDFMEISPHIREYGAGWVIDGADMDTYRKLVRTLIHTPALAGEPGNRARKLLSDRFTFEIAIEPLHRFCQNPFKRQKKRSLFDVSVSLGCARRLSEMSLDSEALRILEDEEKINRDVDSLHYYKGQLFMKQGDFKSAKREFIKERELSPLKIQVLLKLKRIDLYERGDPEVLRAEVGKLLEKYPKEENIRFELSLLYYLSGEKEMAETLFREERDLFRGEVFKIYHMGSELKKRGFFLESLYYFKTILSEHSTDMHFSGGSYFHTGEIYFKQGKLEGALTSFKKCVETLPAHRKAGEYIEKIMNEA